MTTVKESLQEILTDLGTILREDRDHNLVSDTRQRVTATLSALYRRMPVRAARAAATDDASR